MPHRNCFATGRTKILECAAWLFRLGTTMRTSMRTIRTHTAHNSRTHNGAHNETHNQHAQPTHNQHTQRAHNVHSELFLIQYNGFCFYADPCRLLIACGQWPKPDNVSASHLPDAGFEMSSNQVQFRS